MADKKNIPQVKKERIIISLGGSLLVPEDINAVFIKAFKKLIVSYVKKGHRFILVTGGGRTARKYIDAASHVTDITGEDKDWLGIHATRLNAHLVRTVFRKYAHARINTNPHDLEDFYSAPEPIIVAAGWRPGFSTDLDAVLLGKYLDAKRIINLSNIDMVYDRDPKMHHDAKPLARLRWPEFQKIVGEVWNPGMNVPFDPVASKMAAEEKMEVAILNGENLANVENYILGKKFVGTIIRD